MSAPQKERCVYLDRFVKDLWTPLGDGPERDERLSLIALGGYGEGLLCPGSDVDLLFLHRSLPEEVLSKFVESIVYPLWDYRFEVSYRVFTPEEALEFALSDLTFFTSLLSARLLCGSKSLFEKLQKGFEALLSGREKEFYERLKSLREARLSRLGEEIYFLEPHLKDGPGGLRDFQFFLWVGRIIFGFKKLSDFTQAGLLSPGEEARILEAAEFLRRVREELHIFCARKEDRLFMEYQPEMASRLGFGSGDRLATEAFISRLFQSLTIIKEAVEDLLEEIEDLFFPRKKEDRIILTEPVPAAKFLKRIFEIQAEEGRRFDRGLKRYLRGRTWREQDLDELRKVFPDLLRAPHSLLMLRTMRETGVLLALLPEFGPLCGKVQYDVYHLYALDEHLFLTVSALHFFRKEKPDLWKEVVNERVLYWAALLHDLAKGEPDHARRGAERAPEILARFYLREEEIEEVVFLIREHLLLMDTALRRDLAEERVIEEVALKTQSLERLSALYLLTLADAKATGPKALNTWKEGLLEELYFKARKLLRQQSEDQNRHRRFFLDHNRKHDFASSRNRFQNVLKKRQELYRKFSSFLVDRIPLPQLEIYSLQELGKLLSLVEDFLAKKPIFLSKTERLNGIIRVFIVTADKQGLFAELVGTFLAAGFDIRKARAFTWEAPLSKAKTKTRKTELALNLKWKYEVEDRLRRLAVDEFWVEPLEEDAALSSWKSLLFRVLSGEIPVGEPVKKKRRSFLKIGPQNPLLGPPEVSIDQEASDFYTLLEVYAPDQPGLLYEISSLISKEGFIIGKAILSEKEDLVADIFYLQTKEGEKLSAKEAESLRQKIQIKLKEVVS